MGSKDVKVMEPIALSHSPESETENINVEKVEEKSHIEEKDNIVGDQGRNMSMMILRGNLFAIKRAMEDYWLRFGCGGNLERTRTYQVWPGKNVFFFHGRLVCGPDPRGLILTTVSILVSDWVFCVYIGEDLPSHSTLIVAFSFILTIIVLVNLVLVSAINPGIIPRNEKEFVDCTTTSTTGMRKKRVMTNINGVEMNLKYCRKCKIFRPPRSCHCIVCDNCVEKFDHHCPWIGQCIALRNYRFYLLFIASALAFFIYIFGFSYWRIHQTMLRISGNSSSTSLVAMLMRNCPETLALASFSFAASFFLGGLVLFHVYLIAINQTAYENFRERYVGTKNPYDNGILNNFKEVLFMRLPPSRVDFRSEISSRRYPVAASHEV